MNLPIEFLECMKTTLDEDYDDYIFNNLKNQ